MGKKKTRTGRKGTQFVGDWIRAQVQEDKKDKKVQARKQKSLAPGMTLYAVRFRAGALRYVPARNMEHLFTLIYEPDVRRVTPVSCASEKVLTPTLFKKMPSQLRRETTLLERRGILWGG